MKPNMLYNFNTMYTTYLINIYLDYNANCVKKMNNLLPIKDTNI